MTGRDRPPIPADPWHAIIQAKARYGMTLCPGDLQALASRIEQANPRKVRPVADLLGGKRALLVAWWERWVLVVFVPGQRRVATFLPLGAEFTDDGRQVLYGDGPRDWRERVEAELAADRTTPAPED